MIIKFAKYAFLDILELLQEAGVKEIIVTKEDSDLEIVLPDNFFRRRFVTRSTETCSTVFTATDYRVDTDE